MSRVFLFSDPHFGHENMAKKRGFKSAKEHDELIIERWNSVVHKRDIVYLLGDITMEKGNYEVLSRLNGHKRVIGGNHDMPQHSKRLMEYVESISGMVKYKGYILTHCPIHDSEVGRFLACCHGHVHEKTLNDKRYINFSAEVINYTPVLFSKLMNRTDYIVTLELKTSFLTKLLRFFRLKPKKETFRLTMFDDVFKKGDVLNFNENEKVLILKQYE